jgi:hypothetical protein
LFVNGEVNRNVLMPSLISDNIFGQPKRQAAHVKAFSPAMIGTGLPESFRGCWPSARFAWWREPPSRVATQMARRNVRKHPLDPGAALTSFGRLAPPLSKRPGASLVLFPASGFHHQ